jgi:hypothetical protein
MENGVASAAHNHQPTPTICEITMIISTECTLIPAEQFHNAEKELSQPKTHHHFAAAAIKVVESTE